MIIDPPRLETIDGRPALAADIRWEAGDQRTQTVYFATDTDRAGELRPGVEPFLIACCLPAAFAGEARIQTDVPVCPVLSDGLRTNLDYYARWYGGGYGTMAVECPTAPWAGEDAPTVAGMMFSGGMDSLFTLQRNRALFGTDHPRSVKRLIYIDYHGFRRNDPANVRAFTDAALKEYAEQCRRIDSLCADTGLTRTSVYTNVKSLNDESRFWIDHFHGAAMSAVAHAVSRGLRSITFASADMPLMRPYGSHPLTDPGWSRQGLRIFHDSMRFSRLQKTEAVAAWPEGLRLLRVCVSLTTGGQNCGRCEKCLRTMLMLLALGRLDGAPFPRQTLEAADLEPIRLNNAFQVRQYESVVPALHAAGRADLAAAIQEKIRRHGHVGLRRRVRGWLGRLRA